MPLIAMLAAMASQPARVHRSAPDGHQGLGVQPTSQPARVHRSAHEVLRRRRGRRCVAARTRAPVGTRLARTSWERVQRGSPHACTGRHSTPTPTRAALATSQPARVRRSARRIAACGTPDTASQPARVHRSAQGHKSLMSVAAKVAARTRAPVGTTTSSTPWTTTTRRSPHACTGRHDQFVAVCGDVSRRSPHACTGRHQRGYADKGMTLVAARTRAPVGTRRRRRRLRMSGVAARTRAPVGTPSSARRWSRS